MDRKVHEGLLNNVMCQGLSKAAASFSKITNQELIADDFEQAPEGPLLRPSLKGIPNRSGNMTVLVTQLIGSLSGKCFLLLTHEQRQAILSSLPPNISPLIEDAFLLEIDNIVSATVISELSNFLGVEVYGDVPSVHQLAPADFGQWIIDEKLHVADAKRLSYQCHFTFPGPDRQQALYIWNLDQKVFDIIPPSKTRTVPL